MREEEDDKEDEVRRWYGGGVVGVLWISSSLTNSKSMYSIPSIITIGEGING